MASYWQELMEKISTRLHAIVDRALESSSVALYDQSLRDMEAYIAHVEEAAVSMKAAAEGNKRHLNRFQSEAQILDSRLGQLQDGGQSEERLRVQQALHGKQQQIAETQAQITRQEEQHVALAHNWQMLQGRLRVLQAERSSVEALVARARAEQAIRSIEYTLGSLASLGDSSELGAMAGHIMQRLDEAEARLTLVKMDAEVAQAAAALEAAQAEQQLMERRRRLGLVQQPPAAAPDPASSAPPSETTPVTETPSEDACPPTEEPTAPGDR
ncbi:MAG: PspA/IM30 family protein [Chloroflexota bacterium]